MALSTRRRSPPPFTLLPAVYRKYDCFTNGTFKGITTVLEPFRICVPEQPESVVSARRKMSPAGDELGNNEAREGGRLRPFNGELKGASSKSGKNYTLKAASDNGYMVVSLPLYEYAILNPFSFRLMNENRESEALSHGQLFIPQCPWSCFACVQCWLITS